MKSCQKCGAENTKEVLFCSNCGSKADIFDQQAEPIENKDAYCSMCGVISKIGINFCSNCGNSLLDSGNQEESVYQRPLTASRHVGSSQQPYASPYSGGVNYEGQKSRTVAGLLGIFLGTFGAGRFYLGYTGIGVAQLVVSLLTFGAGAIWGLVDGIIILAGGVKTDSRNIPLK